MNKELETRAAKQLRWKYKEGFWLPPFRIFGRSIFETLDLKFTTSYDWSMLGVGAMNNGQLWDAIQILGNGNCCELPDTLLRCKPEQITRSWVEVLEANNE